MTFEAALPEEARGDQFETATPAHFGEVGVDEQEGLSVNPFSYASVQIHTDGTPTEEPSDAVTELPDPDPDAVTVPKIDANLVPDVFTDENGVKPPEIGDEASMRTTTIIPHTSVSSPALTTAPGSAFRGTPEPGADGLAPCGDTEDSSSCGGDEEPSVPPEGPADDVPPTPAVDTQSSIRTDETEIGGTEPSTFAPDVLPWEPSTRPETDNEGSASGEDEASGQDMDPTETPIFTSTLPPLYSSLHSQQPPLVAGAEVTGAPVVLPHVDTVTDAGSGAEQLPRQEEGSGEKGGLTDLPREVSITLLPDVEAVISETSTTEYATQPPFVSPDDKKHPFTANAPTTAPPSQPYSLQTDQSTTTLKPHASQATPSYSGHSTDSVPQGALISDPTATGHVHKEILPPLLELQTQIPREADATKQPEHDTDVSLEASTVNIKGARTQWPPSLNSSPWH